MDDANKDLQILITRLREAIASTMEVCERSQRERVNKLELFQALNELETNTANVAKGIKNYIQMSTTPVNQDVVKESTQLQLEAQNRIVALNTALQYYSQNS